MENGGVIPADAGDAFKAARPKGYVLLRETGESPGDCSRIRIGSSRLMNFTTLHWKACLRGPGLRMMCLREPVLTEQRWNRIQESARQLYTSQRCGR